MFSGWACAGEDPVRVMGEMKVWHTITLTFSGPASGENEVPNPFTDYRLDVEFTNGDKRIFVPGYFAADGDAAETSASEGTQWRVHFCPPTEGTWEYAVRFARGRDVAVSEDSGSGEPCYFHGFKGRLHVGKSDKQAPDFRSKGRLRYCGSRYLRHEGTGEFFIKGGADSPENFLAYREFDGTWYGGNNALRSGEDSPNSGLHGYEPHRADWRAGDPQWQNDKGKAIIGALNYLSSKGMNSIYFLTLNIMGDGEDVWPYADRNERVRFDCSKLDQWEIVFSHAEKLGIMLHVVLQETENECLLDAGYLDVQRKVYLRELAARFSHHLALTWNLGEEHHPVDWSPYGQTYADTKKMAGYLRKTHPYDNFIVIHTHSDSRQQIKDMSHYLGFEPVEGPSVQCGNVKDVHHMTSYWLKESLKADHPWVVCSDEIGPHWQGALPDAVDPSHDTIRHQVLWGNLMAGGGGVEWYFGYQYAHSDLNCEDWRSRDLLWDQTRIALDFFHRYLPFDKMESMDELTEAADDYCFARVGEVYAIYLPEGQPTRIHLSDGRYDLQWFNPRTGGDLKSGSLSGSAGGWIFTGYPPVADGKDWACLIRRR